jgi:PKD repeat protein
VEFIDLSAFINPITSWEWYSGTTLLSTSNHPTITLAAGTYSIKLKIGNGTKYCERTLTINIPAPPVASFTVAGGPFCEAQTVVQLNAGNTNVHHALWDFGDASTFIPQNPAASINALKVFGTQGIYSVTLVVTDNYGCTYTSTQQVAVNDNQLGGVISPATVSFCPGASGVLSFIHTLDLTHNPPHGYGQEELPHLH